MPGPRPTDQSRLRLAQSTSYAAIWVAGEARLFQKKWHRCRSSLSRERARAHGTADRRYCGWAGCPERPWPRRRLQGGDPILIASFLNSLRYRPVVRPEIRTVPCRSRQGQARAESPGFGLGAHRGAQIMLAKLGLNPDTDATMLQIGGDPTRLAALLAGTIDASRLQSAALQTRGGSAACECWRISKT